MLSKKATYSIYALLKLAREYDNGPVLISDIAKSEKLPQKFLESILLELKNIGIVNSKKGKGGGYYLIKSPDDVNLADIIRHFDGAIALLPCVTYKYYEECSHEKESWCGLHSVLRELREETVQFLKNTTLAKILNREDNLICKQKNDAAINFD